MINFGAAGRIIIWWHFYSILERFFAGPVKIVKLRYVGAKRVTLINLT